MAESSTRDSSRGLAKRLSPTQMESMTPDAPPWTERDEAHGRLAVDLVLHAKCAGVGDVGVLEQAVRDLERGVVDAALDDDVLLAPGDVDVALFVLPGEVAVPESILRYWHELVRPVPIGRRELATADDHLALLPPRHLATRVVE